MKIFFDNDGDDDNIGDNDAADNDTSDNDGDGDDTYLWQWCYSWWYYWL